MTKKFTHLILAECEQFYQLRREGFSYAKIAIRDFFMTARYNRALPAI